MHPDPNPKNPLHLNHLFLCIGPFPYVPPSYRSMQTPVIQKKRKNPQRICFGSKNPHPKLAVPKQKLFPGYQTNPKKIHFISTIFFFCSMQTPGSKITQKKSPPTKINLDHFPKNLETAPKNPPKNPSPKEKSPPGYSPFPKGYTTHHSCRWVVSPWSSGSPRPGVCWWKRAAADLGQLKDIYIYIYTPEV